MHQLLAAIEGSAFGVWVRESPSMFAYTGLLSLHAIGLAFAVGFSWFIALRVLGVARAVPLESVESLFPIMWAGFWVNFASGVPLLISNATRDFRNPVFLTKLAVIGLSAMTMVLLRREAFQKRPIEDNALIGRNSRVLAGSVIVLWTAAIVAGRLSEYPWLYGLPSR
jgi:hypothetical protein